MRSYPHTDHAALTSNGDTVTFEHAADGSWIVKTPTETHSFTDPQQAWDAAVAAFVSL